MWGGEVSSSQFPKDTTFPFFLEIPPSGAQTRGLLTKVLHVLLFSAVTNLEIIPIPPMHRSFTLAHSDLESNGS